MPFSTLLDACVLFPIGVCDVLLRVAEAGIYRVLWSEEILAEAERNILKARPDLAPADLSRRFEAMRSAFPEADVTGYEDLVPAMTNDPGDRHVLAAAIRGRADVIVTNNLKHFPDAALAPFGLEVQSADEFLSYAFDLAPEQLVSILDELAQSHQRPPNTFGTVLTALAVPLPELVETVRDYVAKVSPREPWLAGLKLEGVVLGQARRGRTTS